ncbi:expressed unknown protein [Seminavis robusta]|uniref:Uncharacterized protein n=1 Tax=Seminavis robusta TaxID=568900 RepID=A0A9N8DSS6_9STRA|nr:expressed unknown protein [Seminavis robusta]|eukprot:Sro226_g091960.1 n/a (325) ;mRNA; r:15828-16802
MDGNRNTGGNAIQHRIRIIKETLLVTCGMVVRGAVLMFLLFSTWFTVSSAICGYLEYECDQNARSCKAEDYLCMAQEDPEKFHCPSALGQALSQRLALLATMVLPSMPLPSQSSVVALIGIVEELINNNAFIGHVRNLARELLLVAVVHWFIFLAIKTYQHQGPRAPAAASARARLVNLLRELGRECRDERKDFVLFLQIMLVWAVLVAAVLCPLVLHARLRASPHCSYSPVCSDDEGSPSVYYHLSATEILHLAAEEFWRLFMINFLSSSLICEVLFNAGPMLNWWTFQNRETSWVWFVTLSIGSTATIYHFAVVLLIGYDLY